MNQLMLFVVVLVAFIYFGGSNVPKILRNNKKIIFGIFIGLILCSFLSLEGWHVSEELDKYIPDEPIEKVTKGLGDDGRDFGGGGHGSDRERRDLVRELSAELVPWAEKPRAATPSLPPPTSPECKE